LSSANTTSAKKRRTVCVVLVDRANYGRLKPVMKAIAGRPELDLQVVASGTMVLERFQQPVDVVREDGFRVDGEVYMELEGSTPTTMAKSVGFGIVEFSSEFQRLKPDVVLLIGDRYEALAAAIATACEPLRRSHQGSSLGLDRRAARRISKFAQFHFPSTHRSAVYLKRMGERPDTILGTGCPSSDIAREMDRTLEPAVLNSRGSGATIDVGKPFLLVLFHPTTTEFGGERQQMEAVLEALHRLNTQTVLLWPNIDAGSDHISKAIRTFKDRHNPPWLRTLTNLSPEKYLKVLANTACAVGNSSSFVRDAGYFGTPVVLVGNRQEGREHDVHVKPTLPVADEIEAAARRHLAHGRYAPSTMYGDGRVRANRRAAVRLTLCRSGCTSRTNSRARRGLICCVCWASSRPAALEEHPGKEPGGAGGKPLLAYGRAALATDGWPRGAFDRRREIAAVGRELGLDVPFMRSAELARDDTPTLPVIQDVVRRLEADSDRYDAICLLQPTNPLRRPTDIDRCIELLESSGADSVVTMLPVPDKFNPHWVYFRDANGDFRLSTREDEPIPRRQALPPAFHREGSVSSRGGYVMEKSSLFGSRFAASN
jgi:UDP-hydrolysing UDP-N-acetyl-D-glucosamine 2-epimerase